MDTIKTLTQVSNIATEWDQEQLIKDAILIHGIKYHDTSQGYPGTEKISLRKLLDIMDSEHQWEMGFTLRDLNDFILKHKIENVSSSDLEKKLFIIGTEPEEKTGKQLVRELEALETLYIAHDLDFSKLTLTQAIVINNRIRAVLTEYIN